MVEVGQAGRDTHDAAAHQADDLGQPYLRWVTMLSGAAQAAGAARLTEAEDLARRFAEFAPETGFPGDDLMFTVCLAGIRYEQGRLGEVEPALRHSVERLPGVPLFRALLALAYLDLNRPDDARATVAPLGGGDLDRLLSDYFSNATAAVLAGVWAELGLRDEAARLAETLAPYHDQISSHPGIWHGSFAHHLGRLAAALGRFDEAEAHFAAAATTHERLGAPGWLARTRLEWARMCLTRALPGDAAAARSLLTQARAAAGELGLLGIARRAATLVATAPGGPAVER
jgi:tetratricopeptide (TPR) repeat protein